MSQNEEQEECPFRKIVHKPSKSTGKTKPRKKTDDESVDCTPPSVQTVKRKMFVKNRVFEGCIVHEKENIFSRSQNIGTE